MKKTIKELYGLLNKVSVRSAWKRGVIMYARDLLDTAADEYGNTPISATDLQSIMLNGAKNWKQFSESGLSLVYNSDIAERLCAPYELKLTRNGERNPNSRENWLDVQARALYQASSLLLKLFEQ